jgi:hypothetical protein
VIGDTEAELDERTQELIASGQANRAMALSDISASHCLAGQGAGFLPGRSGLPCGGSDAENQLLRETGIEISAERCK